MGNEQAEIFGYEFRDPALLQEALTTPACRMVDPGVADNQRLEFLGDAVLGFMAAEQLYAEYPREPEGSLTIRRTHMVSAAALCAAADRHGLIPRLRRNRGASSPLSANAKTVADAVEAVIGAAYLDGGFAAARAVFAALGLSPDAPGETWLDNPKGFLQERAQAMHPPRRPVYALVKTEGSSHSPTFTVKVTVEGVGEAEASAGNHKEAETRAAIALLRRLLGRAGAASAAGEGRR